MSGVSVLDKTPRVAEETTKYPRAERLGARELRYGTAGFREDAALLVSTCHRMGMLAVLRSKSAGKIVGVMITASHNGAADNGLKLIDPKGEMLSQRWETYAMQLANSTQDKVVEVLDSIVAAEKIDLDQTGNVFIAKDTRPSSEHLAELAREGALVIGGNVLDFGLQTTPQLHHLVRMWNYEQYNKGDWASEVGYYNMLSDAFKQLTATHDSKRLETRTPLYVDCAHGVGALQVAKLAKDLGDSLRLEIVNTPADGELNLQCGAEHVEKSRQPPNNVSRENDRNKRYCSMDGDGDRVVFHYFDDEGSWHLLDGNKIACLFAEFLADKLHALELDQEGVTFGCVMTAYANGAASQYLQSKGIRVTQAKTGVKYCHEKATQFDMAVYFEANGHGTVVFKDALMDKLHKWENTLHDERKKLALSQLLAASQLVNQATGDAMCDLLFVEALLVQKNWSISDWDAIYNDLPSRQTKVKVTDRSVIKSDEEDDTKVLAPESLRAALESALQEYANKRGRAFVRPSGTEDAVRVYAEADTQQDADALALQFAKLVHQHCGGVGAEPDSFVASLSHLLPSSKRTFRINQMPLCSLCGAQTPSGRFCSECGAPFQQPPSLAPPRFQEHMSFEESDHKSLLYQQNGTTQSAIPVVYVDENGAADRSQGRNMSSASSPGQGTTNSGRVLSSRSSGILSSRYSDHPTCDICSLAFDVTKRRHQCRACGRYVCGNCSPLLLLIPEGEQIDGAKGYDPSAPQRACLHCAPRLRPLQQDLVARHAKANAETAPHDARARLHTPFSPSLEKECTNAADIIGNFFRNDSGASGDRGIPISMLEKAHGLAIMTIIKAGFMVVGKVGTGIVVSRLPDGGWSAPSAIGTVGLGGGFQIGGEIVEIMIILGSPAAVQVFHSPQVNLGAGLDIAVGPYGRSAEAAAAMSSSGLNANYSYSISKGLYAGVSLVGSVIATRNDLNCKFYGQDLEPSALLNGSVGQPMAARPLYEALDRAMRGIEQHKEVRTEMSRMMGTCSACNCQVFVAHSHQVWNKRCKTCNHVH